MSTSSFQHLTRATLSKRGQYRYCPSPCCCPQLLFDILYQLVTDIFCLISTSSSRCKSFSVMPWNLVSEGCVVTFFYQTIHSLKIIICTCAIAVFLYLFWNGFIVFDRLWSGSEQAADDWGVRLVSGAPSTSCDALSWLLCSVHCAEISQHFSWMLIFSDWIVQTWKFLNNPTFSTFLLLMLCSIYDGSNGCVCVRLYY